jgi:hypothetical protein
VREQVTALPNLLPTQPSSYHAALGEQLMIVEALSSLPTTAMFPGLPEGALLNTGPNTWAITYIGGNGNDVVLTSVPEPAVGSILFGFVAAAVGGRRVRHMKRRRELDARMS